MSSKSERVILTNPNSSLVLKELVLEDARPYFDLVDSCRAHLSQFGDDTAQKYPNVKSVSTSIKRPSLEEHGLVFGSEKCLLGQSTSIR